MTTPANCSGRRCRRHSQRRLTFLSCTRGDRPVRGATRKACHNCPFSTAEDGLVTDAQVRRLREKRMAGKTLAAAAASAGMSERTARKWRSGPSTAKAPRIDAGEGGR